MEDNDIQPIRVLIVDDSKIVRLALKEILEADPHFKVVGLAQTGLEAVKLAREVKPDVITMDIRMPEMDGFQATRNIMEETPTPIVVVSNSIDDEDLKITYNALAAGALTVLEKPRGVLHISFKKISEEFRTQLRIMS